MLLTELPEKAKPTAVLMDIAKELDKHYIPTRYPNVFEQGAPMDLYTRQEAERSIASAETILEFCSNQVR